MTSKRMMIAAAAFLIAGIASAQTSTDPFSASGGQIELLGKHSDRWSGSLGVTSQKGYSGSISGTLVRDRLWFFASAARVPAMFVQTNVPILRAFDTKIGTRIAGRQDVAAWFAAAPGARLNPSTFMTLHYTGMVSSSSVFTATISR